MTNRRMQGKNRNFKGTNKNHYNQTNKLKNYALNSNAKWKVQYNDGIYAQSGTVQTTHTNINDEIWYANADDYRWVNTPPGYPYDKKKWKYIKGSQSKLQFGSDWYTGSMTWRPWNYGLIVEEMGSGLPLADTYTYEEDIPDVATTTSGTTISEALTIADSTVGITNTHEEEIKALKEELEDTKERVDELTTTVNNLAGIVANMQFGYRHRSQ